MGMTKKTIGIT